MHTASLEVIKTFLQFSFDPFVFLSRLDKLLQAVLNDSFNVRVASSTHLRFHPSLNVFWESDNHT